MAPEQIRVLTITDDQKPYAQSVVEKLKKQGSRVHMDESSDPISGKIKVAQLEQIPWMLIVGKKEQENNTVTLRYLDGKQEFGLTLDKLVEKINQTLSEG